MDTGLLNTDVNFTEWRNRQNFEKLQKLYLLNVESYQESKRYFVHVSSEVDANELK